jgi:hypothetical protein
MSMVVVLTACLVISEQGLGNGAALVLFKSGIAQNKK